MKIYKSYQQADFTYTILLFIGISVPDTNNNSIVDRAAARSRDTGLGFTDPKHSSSNTTEPMNVNNNTTNNTSSHSSSSIDSNTIATVTIHTNSTSADEGINAARSLGSGTTASPTALQLPGDL